MTRDEIMAMKPGPELDAFVAEKVMGLKRGVDFGEWPEHKWKRDEDGEIDIFGLDIGNHNGPRCERCGYGYCHHCQEGPTEPCKVDPEPYSTDIRMAWQVVEKMIANDGDFQLEYIGSKQYWLVMMLSPLADISGKTASEAICKSALLAVCEEAAE